MKKTSLSWLKLCRTLLLALYVSNVVSTKGRSTFSDGKLYILSLLPKIANNDQYEIKLTICTISARNVTVTATIQPTSIGSSLFSKTVNVNFTSCATVNVPASYRPHADVATEWNKYLELSSTPDPITVQVALAETTAIYTALPTSSLGPQRYVSTVQFNYASTSRIVVTAGIETSYVTFSFPFSIGISPACYIGYCDRYCLVDSYSKYWQTSFQTMLNAGQSICIHSELYDLSCTSVIGSQPIAVTAMSYDNNNVVISQMIPTSSWSSLYVAPPTPSGGSGYALEILANGTDVNATLGSWPPTALYRRVLNNTVSIAISGRLYGITTVTADQPVMAIMMPYFQQLSSSPSVVVLQSVSDYRPQYSFLLPPSCEISTSVCSLHLTYNCSSKPDLHLSRSLVTIQVDAGEYVSGSYCAKTTQLSKSGSYFVSSVNQALSDGRPFGAYVFVVDENKKIVGFPLALGSWIPPTNPVTSPGLSPDASLASSPSAVQFSSTTEKLDVTKNASGLLPETSVATPVTSSFAAQLTRKLDVKNTASGSNVVGLAVGLSLGLAALLAVVVLIAIYIVKHRNGKTLIAGMQTLYPVPENIYHNATPLTPQARQSSHGAELTVVDNSIYTEADFGSGNGELTPSPPATSPVYDVMAEPHIASVGECKPSMRVTPQLDTGPTARLDRNTVDADLTVVDNSLYTGAETGNGNGGFQPSTPKTPRMNADSKTRLDRNSVDAELTIVDNSLYT